MRTYKAGGLMELRNCPKCHAPGWPSVSLDKVEPVLYCPECGHEAPLHESTQQFDFLPWVVLIFLFLLVCAVVGGIAHILE